MVLNRFGTVSKNLIGLIVVTLSACLGMSSGSAATLEQAEAQFKENTALCRAVQHPQDRASCFSWANRVFMEAKRGL